MVLLFYYEKKHLTTEVKPIKANNSSMVQENVVQDNIMLLEQLITFTGTLSAQQFNDEQDKSCGTIGAHLRHVIEHYQSVFPCIDIIDYDNRARNNLTETKPNIAIAELNKLKQRLLEVTENKTVNVICSTNTNQSPQSYQSSLYRELVFVHSHTTHHMAIIRILSLTMALPINVLFGKAPSTQMFESNVQSKLA